MIRAEQMERLDAMVGGLDSLHEDGRAIAFGGKGDARLVGGRAKWMLRDKMLRLQHIVDTSNTHELELLRVVGNSARVTFSRATFDDSRPDKQPAASTPLDRHAKVMKVMRRKLARDPQTVIMEAAVEYNLMEPLTLAIHELTILLTPFVQKHAAPATLTKGGRIKVGPRMAAVVEHVYAAPGAAGKFSYDMGGSSQARTPPNPPSSSHPEKSSRKRAASDPSMFDLIDLLLATIPPDVAGKWIDLSAVPPVWPIGEDGKVPDIGLPARRDALEADAAAHQAEVDAGTECPCLIARRFALGILDIEAVLEPSITAIENYYVDAAIYVNALYASVVRWIRTRRPAA